MADLIELRNGWKTASAPAGVIVCACGPCPICRISFAAAIDLDRRIDGHYAGECAYCGPILVPCDHVVG